MQAMTSVHDVMCNLSCLQWMDYRELQRGMKEPNHNDSIITWESINLFDLLIYKVFILLTWILHCVLQMKSSDVDGANMVSLVEYL